MNFSDFFKNPLQSQTPSWMFSPSYQKEEEHIFKLIDPRDLPLINRLAKLMENDNYKKIFNEIERIELAKAKKIAQFWKKDIEDSDLHSQKLPLPTDEELLEMSQLELSKNVGNQFLKVCFTDEEMKESIKHLFDRSRPLSKTDYDMLKIAIWIRKKDPEITHNLFGTKRKIFQTLLARNLTDFTDSIGYTLMQDPCTILSYGIKCLDEKDDPDYSTIAKHADAWCARFLENSRLKILLSKKEITSSSFDPATQIENRRYQNTLKSNILTYLEKAPSYAQNIFSTMIQYMDIMEEGMQEKIWGNLFQKLKQDPQIQKDVIAHISKFFDHSNSAKSKKIFYHSFVKNLPQDLRSEVLGQLSQRTLTRYWKNFHRSEKPFIHSKIKTENGNEYLLWYMFDRGEISNDELLTKIKGINLEKYRPVIFSDKKSMEPQLFIRMASYLAPSKNYFWRWVISFRNVPAFENKLASIYPLFPKEIKENPFYIIAMNNHFDLTRQCAICEDTVSLANLKKTLGKKAFWHSLTKGENSGFRVLCQKGKRWILRALSDLPLEQQRLLFSTPNSDGKTVLDVCPDNFKRMVEENIFDRTYVKPNTEQQTEEERKQDIQKASTVPTVDKNTEKARYPRKIVRLPSFDRDMEDIKTNPELQAEVEREIKELSTMSGARIQAELRKGWKNHGTLEKIPCAVKGIRGDNYRLGYIVRGNADKNKGKIAFLFFWTHTQYNTLLNKQGQQLVKSALLLMKQIPDEPTVPPVTQPIRPNIGNAGR